MFGRLETQFELLIGFINHSQVVTILLLIYTITPQSLLSSPVVFT
jgi:hypothetical protein